MFGKKSGAAGRLAAVAALAGASLGLAALSAHADPYSPQEGATSSVEGVTIYAGHRYATQPTTGRRVRMDRVSMTVPLDDLDLSTHEGALIAKARISQAAKDVCQAVDDAYPGDSEPPGGCYARALHDGLAQAQDQAGYPIVAWGYR
jgi:UrcA family protein